MKNICKYFSQDEMNIFEPNDPELFTAIRNCPLYEKKNRDVYGREIIRLYKFKVQFRIQLSRFPGLETPFGIIKESHFQERLTVRSSNYLEEFDEKLRESVPQFSQAEYKPLVKKSQEIDQIYLKLNDKTKFCTLGNDENIVEIPKQQVVPGSHIVPVICISGVCARDSHWGVMVYLQYCFVMPSQEDGYLFHSKARKVPVIPPPSDTEFCSICVEQKIAIVFLPCGHFCTCASCSERCNTCPICRSPITRKINWTAVVAGTTVFRV